MAPGDLYPVAIIQDRYAGTYSRGLWLAIAESDCLVESGQTRVTWCLQFGPSDDDVPAREFWDQPPDWIAVGPTPDKALKALSAKLASGRRQWSMIGNR